MSSILTGSPLAPGPAPTPPAPAPRPFGDADATRAAIYDNALRAAQAIQPAGNTRFSLGLHEVGWADPDHVGLADQKQAILEGKSLQRRLRGTWVLKDALGNPVDSKTTTVAHVPHLTQRGTFILGGTEYTLAHQMRLRSGIYHREKENGELEAHVNVLPGKGLSHRYRLEPETGVFKLDVSQSSLPLLPVLRALGATDKELRKAWGPELYAANQARDDPKVLDKLYARLVRKPDPSAGAEARRQAVVAEFNRMELDPEVTQRTLGHPYRNITKDAVLASSRKLLALNRREAEPDDRDHLAFQHFMGPEDLIAERLGRDRSVINQMLWKASYKGHLRNLPSGSLTKNVHAAIMTSGLGQSLEEINPTDVFDQQTRVSRLGYGGIPSIDAVPDECYDEATEVFTSEGWLPWPAAAETTLFACLIRGRMEFHRAERLVRQPYDGPLYGVRTRTLDILVTPRHRHWVRKYRGGTSLARCGPASWGFELAETTHRKPRQFLLECLPYAGETRTHFTLPAVAGARLHYGAWDLNDWAEFIGWYVSEGGIDSYAFRKLGKYQVTFSQDREVNPDKVARIGQLLNRLGVQHSYHGHNFVFGSKELGSYLAALGTRAGEKHLPEECFYWPEESRRRLMESLCLGDGHTKDNGARRYCSTSRVLIDQVVRLASTLGLPARRHKAKKHSNPAHADLHYCYLLISTTQGVTSKCRYDRNYYTFDYRGPVYCATVPGELLLVRRNGSVPTWSGNSRNVQPSHLGYIDLVKTPESFKVGIDSRMAFSARKGADGRVYTPFHDPKTGRTVYRSPQDVADLTVAFPNEMHDGRPVVAALVGGRTRMVPRDQVDLVLPHMENAFSPTTNLVPLKSTVKAQRVAMGSRFITQALPLQDAEAPLVRSMVPGGSGLSFEEYYGRHMGTAHARNAAGRVVRVTPNSITVRYADGAQEDHEIYNTFPYNRKTYLHSTPLVKEGDPVRPGQLLARSNYTDPTGAIALGMNARTAYMPYKGLNYEDAYVVSEGMARRLSSEHMYQHAHEWDENTRKGRTAYSILFPGTYDKKTLAAMDEKGVIKPGTVVRPGDPLVLAAVQRQLSHKQQVHAGHKGSWSDRSITWDHHAEGVVTDVAHTDKGVTVAVRSLSPSQVGDKISGRYGDKGVISAVVPDHEMPHDARGRPYEVLANPLGVISRTNAGQVVEAALGKIAEKTGKPYVVEDFNREVGDVSEWARGQLRQHGLSDMEDVTDPTTGRTVKILAGNRYFMKLHHTSECFDDRTEALTARGWVPWPEVGGDDELATARDGRLVFEKPVRLVRYPFDGELCCYEGRYLDYAVTPNHRLYVSFYHRRDRKFFFETAERLHGKRFRVPQFGLPQNARAAHDAGPDTPVRVNGVCLTAGDYAELVGWWASEGYARVSSRRAYVVLYQDSVANPGYFARVERLVRRLGLPWHVYRQGDRTCGLVISSRPLAEYLKRHGTHSHNKRLPRALMNFDPDVLRRAYDAMMAGDGSARQTATGPVARYTTVSRGLADDFQELCVRVGLGATVRRGTDRSEMTIRLPGGRCYVSSCRPVWVCGVALARTVAQADGDRNRGGFSRRPYAGMVYCAEMTTGLLYVRRNGKPMLSGNSKGQGRGLGAYTAEETPAKGGAEGSKRLALMDVSALLSHGATEVLRDGKLVRGQKNQEYWTNFMAGFKPPSPRVPFVYHKFVAQLRAAGVNVVRDGSRQHIMALTDKDIDHLAGDRALRNTETVDWKTGLKPVPGGLFDVGLTGGHQGNRWAHIPLHEPMPNPAFEEPARRLLGLTRRQFEAVLAGQEKVKGRSGPGGVRDALAAINVDQAVAQARADVASGRKTLRDDAVRRLGYLRACQKLGIHPREWVLSKVPVIPPVFRPVSVMQNTGGQLVSDANFLYKELFDANQVLKEASGQLADTGAERLNVYNAFKAVVGLGDPVQPKTRDKQIKGMLRQIFGSSSKFGTVQQKLLGSNVELVGRAVVTPNPDLNMDEVGLPENRAWEVYTPFVVRRLVRRGVSRLQALQYVKDRHALARQAMLDEMGERPVLVNRAPVLHRYGMLAFRPRLTRGDVLQVSPIVVGGFGMDFDGDASNYQVPAEDSARDEALEKMLPSKNLVAVSTLKTPMYQPRQEYVMGLHQATSFRNTTKRPRVFASTQDAVRAYHRGELDPGDPVEILNHEAKHG